VFEIADQIPEFLH